MEKGLGWRVGDGRSISIWNDSWLLGFGQSQHVHSPMTTMAYWASDLILSDSARWDSTLVRTLFIEPKANCILSIPLSFSVGYDVLIWIEDPTRGYSVRSGYQLLWPGVPTGLSSQGLFAQM